MRRIRRRDLEGRFSENYENLLFFYISYRFIIKEKIANGAIYAALLNLLDNNYKELIDKEFSEFFLSNIDTMLYQNEYTMKFHKILDNKVNKNDINLLCDEYFNYNLSELNLKPAGANLINKKFVSLVDKYILSYLFEKLEEEEKDSTLCKQLIELQKMFDLTNDETNTIKFLYITTSNEQLNIQEIESMNNSVISLKDLLCDFLNINISQINDIIGYESKLYKLNLLTRINRHKTYENDFELDENLILFLKNCISKKKLINDEFFIYNKINSKFDIKSFNVDNNDYDIIYNLLKYKDDAKIFIYGIPGTGKTEFIKKIINTLGVRSLWINSENFTSNKKLLFKEENSPLSSIFKAYYFATKNDIIIIDEADYLLNNTTINLFGIDKKKSIINGFLEKCNKRIIFISNEYKTVHESVIRRFDHIIYFNHFKTEDKKKLWKSYINNSKLNKYIKNKDISELTKNYYANASQISNAVLNTQIIIENNKNITKSKIKQYLKTFLKAKENFAQKEEKDQQSHKPITSEYDYNLLNIDKNIDELLNSLKYVKKEIKKSKFLNYSIAFWGIPGTGKTEFAKYLCKTLKMNIKYYRYSDLISPFVGVSEKNIKKMFDETDGKKEILFIDEADSLISDRKQNTRDWKNSITNEILTNMENFNGIIICSTNLINHLDDAIIRRFTLKIKFDKLKNDQLLYSFVKFFNYNTDFMPDLSSKISKLDGLCIGDFFTVKNKIKYNPEFSKYDNDIKFKKIYNYLKEELNYKKNKNKEIGFV